jgi:hypothetical protein
LNFGLTHLNTFAWVGGVSSAPNTKAPEELILDPEKTKEQLKLLYLSCGNKDGLIRISQQLPAFRATEPLATRVFDTDEIASASVSSVTWLNVQEEVSPSKC